MLLACSHVVIATEDVPRLTRFFQDTFEISPHFENEMFSEFVLPNKYRIAFFKPVGLASKTFTARGERGVMGLGLTVKDVEALFSRAQAAGAKTGGPPKEHPWGDKSFLLFDPDENRWEITQSPTADGHIPNR